MNNWHNIQHVWRSMWSQGYQSIHFNAPFAHIPDGPRDEWGRRGPAEPDGEGDRTASNYNVPRIAWGWGGELGLSGTLLRLPGEPLVRHRGRLQWWIALSCLYFLMSFFSYMTVKNLDAETHTQIHTYGERDTHIYTQIHAHTGYIHTWTDTHLSLAEACLVFRWPARLLPV